MGAGVRRGRGGWQIGRSGVRGPGRQSKRRVEGPVDALVSSCCKAVAVQDGSDFVWFWIGDHDEFDVLAVYALYQTVR